jgi:glycosyltransferase involved in cell wall biosynthesis
VSFTFADGRAYRGPAHVLININAPYLSYVFQLLGRRFWREKHVTGYWAWELPSAPEGWRKGLARVHDIAAPSTFVAESFKNLGALPPVRVIPHPVALEAPPAQAQSRADGRFDIVSVFNVASGFERKNPLATIKAFKQAAGDDPNWRLRMLASNAEHYQPGRAALLAAAGEDQRIEISFEALDRDAYWRWFGAPDLYVSLHRSEGFGLTLAEAMLAGVPVLATNWSGNADFMTNDNSMPVRYRLTPVLDPQSKYESANDVWADADTDHAAELMRRAFEDRDWAARLALRARQEARHLWSRFPL